MHSLGARLRRRCGISQWTKPQGEHVMESLEAAHVTHFETQRSSQQVSSRNNRVRKERFRFPIDSCFKNKEDWLLKWYSTAFILHLFSGEKETQLLGRSSITCDQALDHFESQNRSPQWNKAYLMNRSLSLTSASKPPKKCLINCLFNREKLKLTWSYARLSKCSASGYHCCTTPGLWTKRCPQNQQFTGEIGVKTDRNAWMKQVSNVFFAAQHSCRTSFRHFTYCSNNSSTLAGFAFRKMRSPQAHHGHGPGQSTDCSRMVIASHNLKGIPSVNVTSEIPLNCITV